MVQNFRVANRAERGASARRNINGGDLDGVKVDKNVFKPIFQETGTRVDAYFPGYGQDSTSSVQNRADLDIQDDSSTPVAVDGDLRWELYASDKLEDMIAKSDTFRSEALRQSVSSELTDKMTVPQRSPGAGDDRVLVLAMRADSGSDGATVDPSNSDSEQGMPYSRVATQ